jgi:pilus assembly protein TadC
MLLFGFLFIFVSVFSLALAFIPLDMRPKLKLDMESGLGGLGGPPKKAPQKSLVLMILTPLRKLALVNAPLALSLGKNYGKSLLLSQMRLTVEEFIFIKEVMVVLLIMVALKLNPDPSFFVFTVLMGFAAGWIFPDFWLKGRVKKIKDAIVKELPDTVDLLALCVNAGLDFMMAIKYIIEKSPPTLIMEELNNMMQEIGVGKTRRDALRDMAHKYDLPDLYTFVRTLIQADRMGTSVAEALNILSEDMREARFRRGEAMALKAPLKMLVPLLFCIFPVVAILVAGPIFIDFFHNNPLKGLR